MSTYDDASLIYYPSGYKEDKIYSLKPTDGSGDLTFTRASSATRVNADGLIEQVPYNLVQQSNTFNTTWIPSGLSRTANTIANPLNGAVNAYTLTLNSGTASKFITQPISQSGVYTQSVYLKSGTHQFVQLLVGSDASHYANFDLVNGTFSSFGSTIDATIESVIGGWYRCTFTYNTSTGQDVYIWAVNSLSSARAASTSSSGDFYIYGFQLNIGSTAKPYFPTTDRLNVPRIDYTGGGCGKLLLEPQRTNLIPYSNAFNFWTLSGDGVGQSQTSNYAISPDGTNNATRLQLNKTGGTFSRLSLPVTGTIGGTSIAYTIYLKANIGTSNVYIQAGGNISSAINVTSEWTRYEIIGNAPGTTTTCFVGIADSVSGTSETADILIYGAQLEGSGATYPTSYIPTTTTAVTRTQDSATKSGISSLIGQTEGTLFLELDIVAGSPNYHTLMQVYGDFSNRIAIGQDLNSTNVFMYINGSGTASYQVATTPAGHYKIALAYKNEDSVLYINGAAAITTARAISLSTSLSTLFLNNVNGTEIGIFKDSQTLLFKTRLTNAELATLTTI